MIRIAGGSREHADTSLRMGTGCAVEHSHRTCCRMSLDRTCVDGPTASKIVPWRVPMKVSKFMTRDVQLASPTQTIREAAQLMAKLDAGALPVAQDDRLVGMITDRDIAIRAVAQGKSPDPAVKDVMSQEVLYCFDDQELKEIARNMGDVKVRRLPVVNRDKRLVGTISLGDLALNEAPALTATAVTNISKHGGRHSQTTQ